MPRLYLEYNNVTSTKTGKGEKKTWIQWKKRVICFLDGVDGD